MPAPKMPPQEKGRRNRSVGSFLLFLFVLTAIQVMMTMKQYGNLSALAGRDDIPHLQPGLGGGCIEPL